MSNVFTQKRYISWSWVYCAAELVVERNDDCRKKSDYGECAKRMCSRFDSQQEENSSIKNRDFDGDTIGIAMALEPAILDGGIDQIGSH